MARLREKCDGVENMRVKLDRHIETCDALLASKADSNLNNTSSLSSSSVDKCLSEVEDRLTRKKNVMVFGIPEQTHGDTISRKIKDEFSAHTTGPDENTTYEIQRIEIGIGEKKSNRVQCQLEDFNERWGNENSGCESPPPPPSGR